jgi:DNA-binding transcriptional regulator YiaG
MNCHRCNSKMATTEERYQYLESGLTNIFINQCVTHSCPKCNIRLAVLPDSETAAREIVRTLVLQKRRLDGQTVLFLRKAMRLKAAELATILRVDRVSVSRWENNQVAIDAINDFRLRLTAVDRVIGCSSQKQEVDVLKMFLCMIMQEHYETSSSVGNEELTIFSAPCEPTTLAEIPGFQVRETVS